MEKQQTVSLLHYGHVEWRMPRITTNNQFSQTYSMGHTACNVILVGIIHPPVAPFTKEVYPRIAKSPLVFNGCLTNSGLTSLVKEATRGYSSQRYHLTSTLNKDKTVVSPS